MTGRRTDQDTVGVAICAVGLAGMAYCHVKDLGMKLDEHVYYMAALFCCNIAASLLLIPALLLGRREWRRRIWMAAGAVAVLTIAGFLWSRTMGFPRMEDHVGKWDALGLTSVAFESAVLLVTAWQLATEPAARTGSASPVVSMQTGGQA
jgi:hypothetical protein